MFEKVSLNERTVAVLLAHCYMYLIRFNKVLTYPFHLARAWNLDSKITNQIVRLWSRSLFNKQ